MGTKQAAIGFIWGVKAREERTVKLQADLWF